MKTITLKSNPETGRCSWAEQMFIDKFAKYHLHHIVRQNYEVVKETEKAVCVKVPADELFYTESDYLGDDWNVWMPKSACACITA